MSFDECIDYCGCAKISIFALYLLLLHNNCSCGGIGRHV